MLDFFKNTNERPIIRIKSSYLKIGMFYENDFVSCLHARRRQDMREVFLQIYKNKYDKDDFLGHVSKFIKKTNNNIYDFGIDADGLFYIAVEKGNTNILSSVALNKSSILNVVIQITQLVKELNNNNIFFGSLLPQSFAINIDKQVTLIEPMGLNFINKVNKNGQVNPGLETPGNESEVFAIGSLIYTLCTKEDLPIFEYKEQNVSFLKSTLPIKLAEKAPSLVETILKKTICWEQRIESVRALQKEVISLAAEMGETSSESGIKIDFDLNSTGISLNNIAEKINLFWPVLTFCALLVFVQLSREKFKNFKSDVKISEEKSRIEQNFLKKGSYTEIDKPIHESKKLKEEKEEPKIEPTDQYLTPEDLIRTKNSDLKFSALWNLMQKDKKEICSNYLFKDAATSK